MSSQVRISGKSRAAGVRNSQASQHNDPFHGREALSKIAARFIKDRFACPDYHGSSTNPRGKLPLFIAYALHRTKLPEPVLFAALVLLERLKIRFPSTQGGSGHRMFISAYIASSKALCDDTYSAKSWAVVAQGLFSLEEMNQMEREMYRYLRWDINVDANILSEFEKAVKADFGQDRSSYPIYPASFVRNPAATN
ncbi:hypothetical protein M413DRAFT_419944 [Hebeloma cylindrosporum]|uniref:Cyclin N-terminal domain-containing protein n=1 Tax=Hebeloma cylindrosporum TaxID=76867 RepID=A0A0C2XMK1_HEBCY|nr:hypothetical protein M413DRAFT_419944 [Hebeloma cylindrosporum h7]